jgi:hypothetical protein
MDKNVFAATRGLNESEALGRVEPLHSTFSHLVVSAGSKTKSGLPVPANRHVRRAGYAVWRALDSLNVRGFWQKTIIIAAYLQLFACFAVISHCERAKNAAGYRFLSDPASGL